MDIEQAQTLLPKLGTGNWGIDIKQAQMLLCNIGLLDPPADGVLGPATKWALGEFCASARVPFDGSTITDAIAQALSAAKPLPLVTGNDLAGRIVSAMRGKNYFIARHRDCLNIVYVEGMNPDGTLNGNRPNYFDSVRCLVRIDTGGIPKMAGIWEGTTEPSHYWTENPMNPLGAARIKFGQYKSWVMGDYRGDNALIEAADITVFRDPQRLYRRYGKEYTGEFGIHHHHGYDLPKNDEGRSSAGCLIGRLNEGHEEFMTLIRTDARYKADHNYKFMTTVLPAEDLPGAEQGPVVNKPAAAHQVPVSLGDRIFDAYRPEYAADWQRMQILPKKLTSARSIAAKLLANKARYQAVEGKVGVPWYVIAAIHERESSANFATHLHNGDPLTARTVNVPAGRPLTGVPPFTWEESAIDALTMKGLAGITDWSIEHIAYECERYNGWGYRQHGVPSAYLWSYSNIYPGGKYIADHVWSANAQDAQCGVMPLAAQLATLDSSIVLGDAPSPQQKDGGQLSTVPPQPPDPWAVIWQRIQQLEQRMTTLVTNGAALGTVPELPAIDVARVQKDLASLGQVLTQLSQIANQLGEVPTAGLPPQVTQAQQIFTRLGQIESALGQAATTLAGQSAAGAVGATAAMPLSPIDKVLGGPTLVGLKTPIAIVAYALVWILQSANVLGTATGDKATMTGSVLTALIAAFGGLGVTAKFDRGFQALSAIAGTLQKLPALLSPLLSSTNAK